MSDDRQEAIGTRTVPFNSVCMGGAISARRFRGEFGAFVGTTYNEWMRSCCLLMLACSFALIGAARAEETKDARTEKHWAYRELQVVPVPRVNADAEAAGPIDAFLLDRLQQRGW